MKLGVQQVEPFFGRLLRLMHCWHYYMMGLHRKSLCCQICLDNFTHIAFVEILFFYHMYIMCYFILGRVIWLYIFLYEKESKQSAVLH